jgi:hypothetical protein
VRTRFATQTGPWLADPPPSPDEDPKPPESDKGERRGDVGPADED